MSNRIFVGVTLMNSNTSLHSVLTHVLTASSSLSSSEACSGSCTHMRCGRGPCGSWWFRRSSRPRTDTSNLRVQTAPPPAVAWSLCWLLSPPDLQARRENHCWVIHNISRGFTFKAKEDSCKKKKKKRWMSHKFRLLRQQLILKLLLWWYGFYVSLRSKCQSEAQ